MSLGDELFELRTQRSKGRIGPIEYYESLARLIDASPDAFQGRDSGIFTFIRRIEALLEDKLGASGIDIEQKIESRADRVPPDLRNELRCIAELWRAISRGDALSPVEISGVQTRCAQALRALLHRTAAVSPPRSTAFPPPWAKRGVVRKVRHSQRQILPGGNVVEYVALIDIDGRLEMITSPPPPQIECGDRVVIAGWVDHRPVLYHNESRSSGNKMRGRQTTAWVLAALAALATLAGELWYALLSAGRPTVMGISGSSGGAPHSS
jgi:hypothetical protein